MIKCHGCNYSIGEVYRGYCEQCRKDYGVINNRYKQAEQKKSYSDLELEELTDGEFINIFGYASHIKEEDEN